MNDPAIGHRHPQIVAHAPADRTSDIVDYVNAVRISPEIDAGSHAVPFSS
jgi:hypothetical protein